METVHTPDDLISVEPYYERADTGKRFLNYIIDLVLFYGIIFGIGILIALTSPSTLEGIDDNSDGFGLVDRILTIIAYAIYMGIMEAVFKGKSLGKWITRTRAVTLDGQPISTGTAFLRGLSRAVPFCAFSAFGNPPNPWQDKWTDTMVIDEKKTRVG